MEQVINELVKVDGNNVIIADDVCSKLRELNSIRKQADELEKTIKFQLQSAMEKCGIKSFDNQYFRATYVESKPRQSVDTKALQIIYPEVYQELLKTTEVSPSLRMTYKEAIKW